MKRKILILVLVSFIFAVTSNFTFAQDPNDPNYPDTVWLSIVPMDSTWSGSFPKPFAVECSCSIDQKLAGISIPISFYHSQNRDIKVDSIKFSTWFTDNYPILAGSTCHNDSVGTPTYSPKSFYTAGLWYLEHFPLGRGLLFTVYFNGDTLELADWDTTKSIVLDSILFHPPGPAPEGMRLEFTDTLGVNFNPVFRYGVIGDTAVISGTVYSSGSAPDSGVSVYCRGKDVTTSYFPGRVLENITDGSGNFRFAVGKGGYWCVFRDTADQMIDSVNAYCFDSLVTDTSGIDFKGYFLPEYGVFISGCVYHPRYPKPDSTGTQRVYLSGDMESSIRIVSGDYEFSVLKDSNYCVWMDTSGALTDTNSWCFTPLSSDTSGKDFIKVEVAHDVWIREAAQGALIKGITYYDYEPDSIWSQYVRLSGWDTYTVQSDTMGYYEIGVPKGKSWHNYNVYLDTTTATGGLMCDTNAYCFSALNSDQPDKDFEGKFIRGKGLWVWGKVYKTDQSSEGSPFKIVHVSGDLDYYDSADPEGNYESSVYKNGEFWIWVDTSGDGGFTSENSYHFTDLLTDKDSCNFIYGDSDPTGVTEGSEEKIPRDFCLFQNYPNPFNPNTVIEFALPKDCWVKVEVFNLLGQKIRTLADKAMKKGIKKIIWNGKNEKGAEVSSGIYFYRIKTDEFTGVKKMILIK